MRVRPDANDEHGGSQIVVKLGPFQVFTSYNSRMAASLNTDRNGAN